MSSSTEPTRTRALPFDALLDLLDGALDAAPTSVIVVEPREPYRIVLANRYSLALRGADDLAGAPFDEAFPPSRTDPTELLRAAAQTGERQSRRGVRYDRITGVETLLEGGVSVWDYDVFPLGRGQDGPLALAIVGRDVTLRVASEQRMREAHNRALGAILSIAGLAESEVPLRRVLGQLSSTVAGLVGADCAAFFMLRDRVTLALEPDGWNVTPGQLAQMSAIRVAPDGGDLPGRVVYRDEVVTATAEEGRAGERVEYRPQLAAFGMRDVISCGWQVGGRPLGSISAWNSLREEGFADDAEWILRMAATTAALVVETRLARQERATFEQRSEDALQSVAQRLAALERVKSDFMNLAAHELRGPLGVLRGYLSMLHDGTLGALTPAMQQVVPVMGAKADEMMRMIEELLETARLDAGAVVELVPVDLGRITGEAVERLGMLTSAHELRLDLPAEPVTVLGDGRRLQTAIGNLLDNAVKYSPRGGTITVTVGRQADTAILSVGDEGLGIAPGDLERLFERFGRIVTPENGHIRGTGLGLYLTREIVHLHRGEITVTSGEGRGTTFTVRLPLAAAG